MVSLEISSAEAKVWRRFTLADQRRLSNNYRLTVDWDNLLWVLSLFTGGNWKLPEKLTSQHLEPLVVRQEFVGWQFPPTHLGIVSSELETSLVNSHIDWQALGLQRGDWLFIGEDGYSFTNNIGGFARVAVVEIRRVILDLCSWLPLTEQANHSLRVFVGRTARASQGDNRLISLKKANGNGWLSLPVQSLALEIPCHGQLIVDFRLGDHQLLTRSQAESADGLSSAEVVDSAYFCCQYGSLAIKDLVISSDRQGITGLVRLPSTARLPSSNIRGGLCYTLRLAESAIVIDLPQVIISEQCHEDSLYKFVAENSSLVVVHFPYFPATG